MQLLSCNNHGVQPAPQYVIWNNQMDGREEMGAIQRHQHMYININTSIVD